MPHKKNPDVAELLRANTNRSKALPMEITLVLSNLPSGYHRDMQLLKEILMPAIEEILDCLDITTFMLENMQVKKDLLNDPKYDLMFSVEKVNELVVQGMPFRDAYRQVGQDIASGAYQASRELNHSHEGSIGNLQTEALKARMADEIKAFKLEETAQALQKLINL